MLCDFLSDKVYSSHDVFHMTYAVANGNDILCKNNNQMQSNSRAGFAIVPNLQSSAACREERGGNKVKAE